MDAEHVNSIIDEALSVLLEAHGFPTVSYRGWLAVANGLPGFRATFAPRDDLHSSLSQVDFEIAAGIDSIIVESFAAPGETAERVAQVAIEKFASSSLHVILAGLCGDDRHAEQVEIERWTGSDGTSWRVYIGGWQLFGYNGAVMPPSTAVFDVVEALAKHHLRSDRDLHWCRVFDGNFSGARVVEALWNNEPWDRAKSQLEATDWEVAIGQTSRCFVLFRKEEAAPVG